VDAWRHQLRLDHSERSDIRLRPWWCCAHSVPRSITRVIIFPGR
jgi:hypothetical protein